MRYSSWYYCRLESRLLDAALRLCQKIGTLHCTPTFCYVSGGKRLPWETVAHRQIACIIEACSERDARMNQKAVKGLAEKFDAALAILDEIRAASGFDVFGEERIRLEPRCETALQAAERAYEDRRSRSEQFSASKLFGEPAWDILLDLFIHQSRHEQATVRSACLGSGTSDAVATRWLQVLENEGLVQIMQDLEDKNRRLVSLTAEGYESMLRYLEKIAR